MRLIDVWGALLQRAPGAECDILVADKLKKEFSGDTVSLKIQPEVRNRKPEISSMQNGQSKRPVRFLNEISFVFRLLAIRLLIK